MSDQEYERETIVLMREMEGKTVEKLLQGGEGNYREDFFGLLMTDGTRYYFYHAQDCCENVYLEDVAGGELEDLEGEQILHMSERTSTPEPHELKDDEYVDDLMEWTFYVISTMKVTLTLRFLGASNGYYAVGVDIRKVEK